MGGINFLPDHEIPTALKRKPVFGDREQIRAIYDVEAKIEKRLKEMNVEDTGDLRPFIIRVNVRGSGTIRVMARDKAHARELLDARGVDLDDCDHSRVDYDIDFITTAESERQADKVCG